MPQNIAMFLNYRFLVKIASEGQESFHIDNVVEDGITVTKNVTVQKQILKKT